jgi:cullin 3
MTKKSENEVDQIIDLIIGLFRYIKDKDVFERYYKQHLAKRLLQGKNVDEDLEKSVLSKLKTECGSQFTSKLEGMFNDIKISQDLNEIFCTLPNSTGLTLNVNVLTTTNWPIASYEHKCTYPSHLLQNMEKFQTFYLSRYSGRRLTWMSNLGNADIKAYLPKGTKEINMSTFAMIVLLSCFNEMNNDEISYESIKITTGIHESDLKRTLQSLSVAKYRILTKSPQGKEIRPDDTFKINEEFTAPQYKFKLLTISASAESDGERKETMTKVDEDRKHQIEAVIVRIMKSRKTMDHNQLVAEVLKQTSVRFQADPAIVKRRIEGLIEREYLERDKEDRKMYHYLA